MYQQQLDLPVFSIASHLLKDRILLYIQGKVLNINILVVVYVS